MHDRPRRRSQGIVSERVDDDLVVYDQVSQLAHCLSPEAAAVWERSDGSRSADEIGLELTLEPAVVERALSELARCGLLDDGPTPRPGYSRREAAVKFAKVGGVAFSAPLIYSVVIPSAAAAASCKANGVAEPGCTAASGGHKAADAACCSGTCYNGNSTGKICAASNCSLPGLGCIVVGNNCCSGTCVALFCTN